MSASVTDLQRGRFEEPMLVEQSPNGSEVALHVISIRLRGALEHGLVVVVGGRGRLRRQRLGTPDTEVLLARSVTVTSRTGDGTDVALFFLDDVEAVESRVLGLGSISKASHVPRDGIAPASASLSVLDEGSVRTSSRQPARVRLAEVGGRHGFVDAGTVSSTLEVVEEGRIGGTLDLRELRPERCIGVIWCGMVRKPALEIGNGGDEVDAPLTGLSVDANLEAILAVIDVPDGRGVELAVAAHAGVELHRDESGVAGVPTGLDHRDHVVVPIEHIRGIGRGVVITRIGLGDPIEAVGQISPVGITSALAEDTEGNAIVSIRLGTRSLLGVVLAMDPADDRLSSIAVFQGLSEGAVGRSFSHSGTVSEELDVPETTVFLSEEVEAVREGNKHLAIGFTTSTLTSVDASAEGVDLLSCVLTHGLMKWGDGGHVSTRLESRPRLFGFHSFHKAIAPAAWRLSSGLASPILSLRIGLADEEYDWVQFEYAMPESTENYEVLERPPVSSVARLRLGDSRGGNLVSDDHLAVVLTPFVTTPEVHLVVVDAPVATDGTGHLIPRSSSPV